MMNVSTRFAAAGAALALTASLAACSSGDPLSSGEASASKNASSGTSTSIVVGSAAFPESEILAYIYAGALNNAGVKATVKPNIGARDVYVAALNDNSIQLVPEYTGNLLQYYDKNAKASSDADVYTALQKALPSKFKVLDRASAEDADSYNVTSKFSKEHNVRSIADLKNVKGGVKVAANPEFAKRPYGIPGLRSEYGIDATLVPINDGGGPNTVKALTSGQVDVADIYSTTPAIKQNKLVTLTDPKNLIMSQNVVPLLSSSASSPDVDAAINKVQDALTTADLTAMNARSSGASKVSAQTIANDWLKSKGLD